MCQKKPSSPPAIHEDDTLIVTIEELEKAKTVKGGFTGQQVKLAQRLTGSRQWKCNLVGMRVEDEEWQKFLDFSAKKKRKKKEPKRKQVINSFSVKSDWSWKPKTEDIPEIKYKGKLSKDRGKNRKRKAGISKRSDKCFYNSPEWKQIRVRVLEKYECRCMMCGRNPRDHGVVIHVDHIKPRSKYPELSLDFDNLQILCDECNTGKSNKYETDWRPESEENVSDRLDEAHLASIEAYM